MLKYLLIVYLLIVLGCTPKADKEEIKSEPESSVTKIAPISSQPSEELKPKLSKHSSDPVVREWKNIWNKENHYKALKEFAKKHGVFLEVSRKTKISYLATEGPCGSTYMGLVKKAKGTPETIWEINSAGKVINAWNVGSMNFLRISKNKVFRSIRFYEDPSDFEFMQAKQSKSHEYVLQIDSKDNIEVLQAEKNHLVKAIYPEVKCPKSVDIKSDYKYCVKDAQHSRLFVLQKPCT